MSGFLIIICLFILAAFAFFYGRRKMGRLFATGSGLQSTPVYYGILVALWCGLPALLFLFVWQFIEPLILEELLVRELPAEFQDMSREQLDMKVKNMAAWLKGAVLLVFVLVGAVLGLSRLKPGVNARHKVEKLIRILLFTCSIIAILTTIGIVLSVLFEALRFFKMVGPLEFLFGLKWSPQTAIRPDQVASSGAFGVIPVFAGTIMITVIAMLVAFPVGLMSAIYLSEYASKKFRAVTKPLLEILAGVPTVVYGFFAAITMAPLIRQAGEALGIGVSSESALAAGVVMGIMIIPFVSSLSDDVIHAVPRAMREGAYGLGATKAETIRQVVLPAALPGIVGGGMLAVSRAIGETMIVVMAAGLSANLTANPLESVTTVTVQIVSLLTGDQEFDSAKTLAAFALALLLFVVTLFLNLIALIIVRRYREQYE
ncbi:MAG: phosphate ABC transporter permease subunit PstC [Desulfurivibrionaceae bacterium]